MIEDDEEDQALANKAVLVLSGRELLNRQANNQSNENNQMKGTGEEGRSSPVMNVTIVTNQR